MLDNERDGDADGASAPAADDVHAEANGTEASNSAVTKRLLPMELRRRRRAAKLLESAAAVSKSALDGTLTATTVAPPSGDRAPAQDVDALVQLKRSASERSDVDIDAHELPPSRSVSTLSSSSASVQPTPSTTAAARLSSFYSWSAVDRKRQRLQTRQLADVPSRFHAARVPIDLTPKTKVTLLTAFPLPFLRPSSAVRRASMASVMKHSPATSAATQQQLSNEIRWHRALHYFAHPAAPLPASITLGRVAAAAKTSGVKTELLVQDELAFFDARQQQWQHAFRDAYFGFRGLLQHSGNGSSRRRDHSSSSASATLYVRANDCVVCFYHEANAGRAITNADDTTDMRERELGLLRICLELREQQPLATDSASSSVHRPSSRLCAVVSQSTARVRKALHHLHVEYAVPYSSASAAQRDAGRLDALEAELVAIESAAANARTAPTLQPQQQNVHGADSLLHFRGHQAVHGLYEFLINRKPLTKEDVPEIFALHPFVNAAIKSLDVKYMGHVAIGASASDESTASTMFRTEVSGFCFPSALRELIDVLKSEYDSVRAEPANQRSEFSSDAQPGSGGAASSTGIAVRAYMEPLAQTERFNALHLSTGAIRRKTASTTTLEERESWKQELELSKRRIENVIVRTASSNSSNSGGGDSERDGDDNDASALFEIETTARTL